jgi:hypothetical protein
MRSSVLGAPVNGSPFATHEREEAQDTSTNPSGVASSAFGAYGARLAVQRVPSHVSTGVTPALNWLAGSVAVRTLSSRRCWSRPG